MVSSPQIKEEEALTIDMGRWTALLRQLADTRYQLRGSNAQLTEIQDRWAQCCATRDRAASNDMIGHGDPAIAKVADANLAAAQAAVDAAQVELERVRQRVAEVSSRFSRLSEIVRQCVQWAAQRGTFLPDGDAASVQAMPPTTPTHGVDAFSYAVEATVASMATASSAPSAGPPAAGPPGPGLFERIGSALGLGGAA